MSGFNKQDEKLSENCCASIFLLHPTNTACDACLFKYPFNFYISCTLQQVGREGVAYGGGKVKLGLETDFCYFYHLHHL